MAKIIGNTTATTSPQSDYNQTDSTKADYIKNKPVLGTLASKSTVEKSDLSTDVQESLNKADSALQSFTETDPTVPAWAKADAKPTYTASEVGAVPTSRTVNGKALSTNITLSASDIGALPSATAIPDSLSDLASDATHRTVTDIEKSTWNAKSDFSGSYNDLTDKPSTFPPSAHTHEYIPTSQKGAANGVADLDTNGKVPSSQLPSYVDDVIEGTYVSSTSFNNTSGTAVTGETGKIYVDTTTNKTYRWSGSAYVEISASLALGTTSSTAYRGDYGNTAYTHSQKTSGNPHGVTKSDVGLGSVVNTGDSDTPVSGGTTKFTTGGAYTELAKKVDKVSGKGLSTNDYTTDEKDKLAGIAEGANNYSLPAAGSSLGGVKTGGDVTISSGVITVNDDSHNHVISNVDGLQDALDSKLSKTTYEYNKELSLGSTGNICIGVFPCYDSNISVEIKSTTNTTYNGTLIIATQNINTSHGGNYAATVYGDEKNTLTSAIKIQYVSGSNAFSVYANLPSWSKNIIHIQCASLAGAPSSIVTVVDSIPSTATIIPTNAFIHNQASNTINAMTGYSKPSSTSAITTSDTLNSAIGKLEAALDGVADLLASI